MLKIIALYLAFVIFMVISESPLGQYIPEPIQNLMNITDQEFYEIPYTLSIAVPKEDFSWKDNDKVVNVYELTEEQINLTLSVVNNLNKENKNEYIYKINNEEFVIHLFSLEDTEAYHFIDFQIYPNQIEYFDQVYTFTEQAVEKIDGAKIMDYQYYTFVTPDNLEEIKEGARTWFEEEIID